MARMALPKLFCFMQSLNALGAGFYSFA
jgi:hypothetical protein